MSKLEELIKELCPEVVEYKSLDDCAYIIMGTSPNGDTVSSDPSNGIEFHQGKSYFGNMMLRHSNTYTTLPVKETQSGSIVMSVRAPVGDTNLTDRRIAIGRGLCGIWGKKGLETKFLYYYLNMCVFEIKKKSNGSTFESINSNDVKSIRIPLPPLSVQREIVRIMDNFTELTAELTAELTGRKKQYEYYRDLLFDFGDDVPRVKLIDITDISRGVRVVKKQLIPDGKYPVYQNCLTAMGYYDKHNCDADTTYVISAGAAGEIGFSDKDFWAADDCLIFSNLNGVINKYIYYFLTTKQDFIRSNVRRASIPRLSRRVIENLQIPFVPLEEQERIVAILDRFDALCNDLTSGLPAEIEARRKQYEYYRDKLLTFKEAKA